MLPGHQLARGACTLPGAPPGFSRQYMTAGLGAGGCRVRVHSDAQSVRHATKLPASWPSRLIVCPRLQNSSEGPMQSPDIGPAIWVCPVARYSILVLVVPGGTM